MNGTINSFGAKSALFWASVSFSVKHKARLGIQDPYWFWNFCSPNNDLGRTCRVYVLRETEAVRHRNPSNKVGSDQELRYGVSLFFGLFLCQMTIEMSEYSLENRYWKRKSNYSLFGLTVKSIPLSLFSPYPHGPRQPPFKPIFSANFWFSFLLILHICTESL